MGREKKEDKIRPLLLSLNCPIKILTDKTMKISKCWLEKTTLRRYLYKRRVYWF